MVCAGLQKPEQPTYPQSCVAHSGVIPTTPSQASQAQCVTFWVMFVLMVGQDGLGLR